MKYFERYKSIFFLFLASIILSSATPLIAKLDKLGIAHQIHGRSPISFCNILFLGNMIAFFVLLAIYAKSLRKTQIKKVGRKNWVICVTASVLSGVLYPAFFFLGIEFADVLNVIILSTLEIPLMLLIGIIFFHERVKWGVVLGALIILAGIVATGLLQKTVLKMHAVPHDRPLYHFLATHRWSGEVCVVLAIIFSTISTFLSRYAIQALSPGFYNLFRVGIGAVIFFWIATLFFGIGHFAELFSPFLWEWMLVFGGIVVGLRTYFNYIGLKHAQAAEIAISASIVPVFSTVFAFLILGEVPGRGQWIGGSITLFGIGIALVYKLMEKERVVLQKPIGFPGN